MVLIMIRKILSNQASDSLLGSSTNNGTDGVVKIFAVSESDISWWK
jgi:hypothetical protein